MPVRSRRHLAAGAVLLVLVAGVVAAVAAGSGDGGARTVVRTAAPATTAASALDAPEEEEEEQGAPPAAASTAEDEPVEVTPAPGPVPAEERTVGTPRPAGPRRAPLSVTTTSAVPPPGTAVASAPAPTPTSTAKTSDRCEAAMQRQPVSPASVQDVGAYRFGSNLATAQLVTAANDVGVWSPDGTRIAFTVEHDNRREASLCVAGPSGAAAEVRVTPSWAGPARVAWAGDRQLVLPLYDSQDANLSVVDVTSGAARTLLRRSGSFAVAPDGRTVLATPAWGDPQALLLIDVATGATRKLLDLPDRQGVTRLQWWPDGTSVAYAADAVYTVRVSDGVQRQVAGGDAVSVDWSSSGAQVAFADGGNINAATELVVASADGGGRRVVATGSFTHVRWRPGTNRVTVLRRDGSRTVVSDVDVSTGTVTDLVAVDPGDARVSVLATRLWLPDGDLELTLWRSPV